VELRGLEPLTPCMPCRCATSCATAPNFRCSGRFPRSNLISLMHFCLMRQSGGCETFWRISEAYASGGLGPSGASRQTKNPPESNDSGGLSGGAEGTRTPDPLHAMQVRYQLRHSPELLLLPRAFFRASPKQLKYLRTAIPKIPNREYSACFRGSTRSRRRPWPWLRRRHPAGGPPRGSPSRGVPGRKTRGLLHAGRG
jgi:hypothetical protein